MRSIGRSRSGASLLCAAVATLACITTLSGAFAGSARAATSPIWVQSPFKASNGRVYAQGGANYANSYSYTELYEASGGRWHLVARSGNTYKAGYTYASVRCTAAQSPHQFYAETYAYGNAWGSSFAYSRAVWQRC
jgi:hypothetical protein